MNKIRHMRNHKGPEYRLNQDLAKIKAAFSDAGRELKDTTANLYNHSLDNIKDKSKDMQDDVQTFVAKNPLKALGIAAAVGLVMGFLLRK